METYAQGRCAHVGRGEYRIGELNPFVRLEACDPRMCSAHDALSFRTVGPLPFIELVPNRSILPDAVCLNAIGVGSVSLTVFSTRLADLYLRRRPSGLVAVVVPSYNVQDLVWDSLQSILGQDYHAVEVIVIDDDSQDATSDNILRFMQEHSDSVAVRFMRIPHMGNPGLTRNVGIFNLISEGVEYVAFMDGDDLYASPRALRRLVETLRQHNSAIAAFGDYDWISSEGTTIAGPSGLRQGPGGRWSWRRSCELTWDNIAASNLSTYHLQCLMVRKGAPLLTYHPRGEDHEYYGRLFRISSDSHEGRLEGVRQIPELIAHYRKRRNSLSNRPSGGNEASGPPPRAPLPRRRGHVPYFYDLAGIPDRYATPNNISLWATKQWARMFWRSLFCGQLDDARRFARCALGDRRIYRRHLAWVPLVDMLSNPMVRGMGGVLLGRIWGLVTGAVDRK